MGTEDKTEIDRLVRIRLYQRLLRRYGEERLLRHMKLSRKLFRAVSLRISSGRP